MHFTHARSVLLLLSLLMAQPGAVSAAEAPTPPLAPPQLQWCKGFNVLNVRVQPAPGSHLASDQPVRAVLDDASYFRVRWAEFEVPERGPLRLRLPRVSSRDAAGWTLKVTGAVCSEDGSSCLPFVAETNVPRGPKAKARFEATAGFGGADQPKERVQAPSAPAFTNSTTEIQKAFASAQERRVPLLVDFYARWCPPCERLKAEFLSVRSRQDLLKRFEILKVDADATASFTLKDRYSVGGYPTVLLLNPDGRELDRIVGWSGDPDLFATRLERVLENWNREGDLPPFEQARRLLAAGEGQAAWDILLDSYASVTDEVTGEREKLLLALEIARAAEAPELPEMALLAAEAAPLPGEAASFAALAIGKFRSRGESARAGNLQRDYSARIAAALDSRLPVTAERGRGDASMHGTFSATGQEDVDRLDDSAGAAYHLAKWNSEPGRAIQVHTEAAVRIAAAIAVSGELVLPQLSDGRRSIALPEHLVSDDAKTALTRQTGRVHDLVFLLKQAELPLIAETILRRMVAIFPRDFTWHYKLGGLLRQELRQEEAEESLRLALKYSYDDNRLRATMALAELLQQQERSQEALVLLDEALMQPAPQVQDVRTHRYRSALEELRERLEAGGTD